MLATCLKYLFFLLVCTLLHDFLLNIYFKVVEAKQKESKKRRIRHEWAVEDTPSPEHSSKQSAPAAAGQFENMLQSQSQRNFGRFMCDTGLLCKVESL